MLDKTLIRSVQSVIRGHGEIIFAYIHGSSLYSAAPRDVDIGIYIDEKHADISGVKSGFLDYSIPLELEMERSIPMPADIQVLNHAPLPVRFRVVTRGMVVHDCDPLLREHFELLSRVEYFDFLPRREAYLKESLT